MRGEGLRCRQSFAPCMQPSDGECKARKTTSTMHFHRQGIPQAIASSDNWPSSDCSKMARRNDWNAEDRGFASRRDALAVLLRPRTETLVFSSRRAFKPDLEERKDTEMTERKKDPCCTDWADFCSSAKRSHTLEEPLSRDRSSLSGGRGRPPRSERRRGGKSEGPSAQLRILDASVSNGSAPSTHRDQGVRVGEPPRGPWQRSAPENRGFLAVSKRFWQDRGCPHEVRFQDCVGSRRGRIRRTSLGFS